jgi:hypothetical protein
MSMFPTYCEIYRLNPPSSVPAATHVPCQISGVYSCGSYQTTPVLRPWTHVLEFDLAVDVRDSYPGQAGSWLLGNADTLKLEDPAGMLLVVIIVEETVNADGNRIQRVYADRQHVGWPIMR